MVNTREIAAEYRRGIGCRYYKNECKAGLSIKGYCKQMGICENTYFYW